MPALALFLLLFGQVLPDAHETTRYRVNGKLELDDGHRILHLRGSHFEMGFAHGYLMGPEIMEMVEDYGLGVVTSPMIYTNYLLPVLGPVFKIQPRYLNEIKGMVEGMRARGTDLFVGALGRDLTETDLLMMNLIPDLSRYGCSVAFGWGGATANDEDLAGGSAMVRDLDWGYDPTGLLNTRGVIMVFHPSSPEERGFVSISWPGLISCISAFNVDGIGATINYGNHNGFGALIPNHFSGIGFTIREGLERKDFDGDGYETHLDVYESIRSRPHLASFEISLISPYPVPGYPGLGAGAVLEINYWGHALRDASHNRDHAPKLNSEDLLAVTNHHRLLYAPVACTRYDYQVSELSADFEVDTDELWQIEADISHQFTMHMVAFRPNLRDMYVAFNETFQGAANSFKNHYRLADLFP